MTHINAHQLIAIGISWHQAIKKGGFIMPPFLVLD